MVPDVPPEERVLICRLVIPLPEDYPTYHAQVPREFPNLRFEILSRVPAVKESIEDITVSGESIPPDFIERLRQGRGVREVAVLERSERSMMVRVTFAMSPGTRIYTGLQVPLRYPIPFDRGEAKLLVVGTEEKVRRFYEQFRQVAPNTTITAIRKSAVEGPDSLLTPKQEEAFKMAMSMGYWDSPRRITLTELASFRRVAKSTLAETLAQVERKLLYELRDQHFSHWNL
jgi:hypothetical protein